MAMKFNPFAWSEITSDEVTTIQSGLLHVMSTHEAEVWCVCQGVEVLVGVGKNVKAEIADALQVTVKAPKGHRTFIYELFKTAIQTRDGMFTNIDKRPVESETMIAVKTAIRQIQLEKLQLTRERNRAAWETNRRNRETAESDEVEPVEPVETEEAPAEPAE